MNRLRFSAHRVTESSYRFGNRKNPTTQSTQFNQPRGFGPNQGAKMKIILNQQEVLDIVLASVKNRVHEPFNDIVLEKYSDDNFVTIRYVEPNFEESDK
jgi:hypothetical protein